jgi:hypothetical protein
MKKLSPHMLPALWLALLAGCSASSRPGSVQLAVSAPQSLSSSIARVSVTASAADFPSVSADLVSSGGSWSGTLDNLSAGANRSFLAQAFDSSGTLLFQGAASGVSIVGQQTALVAITLQQVNAPPPLLNAAPFIDSLVTPSSSVAPGGSLSLVATAHDPNPGDTLSYAWSATAGAISSPAAASTSWTAPASTGIQTLTFTVTDAGGLSASFSLAINVTHGGQGSTQLSISFNRTPVVASLSAVPTQLAEGQATAVSISASDLDGDNLSYAWSASCSGSWTNASSGSAQFTPDALPVGGCNNCRLTVTVSDGRGGQNTGTLALCVRNPPPPERFNPFILSAFGSSDTASPAQVLTFEVEADDPQDSALTFSWAANTGLLGNAASSASTSRITWMAPSCISEDTVPAITATVTNAFNLTASRSFTVTGLPICLTGWASAGAMASPRQQHTTTLLPNGKLLVSGGNATSGPVATAELYEPASGTWSQTAAMASPRHQHAATLLSSGKVLVTGGYSGSGYLLTVEVYNPASGTWSAAAPMASPRNHHTATLLPNGTVLVAGGSNSGGSLASAEVYNPASGTWRTAGSMATPRQHHAATLLPTGKVLISGGYSNGSPLDTAEVYDPASGTWSEATPMASARGHHSATLLSSGKVLVSGGMSGGVYLASAELYDPASGTWSATGAMASPHAFARAMLLPTGKVLVSGGYNNGSPLASAEAYDPATGTWSAAASMASARYDYAAARLTDGKVLVSGGYNGVASLAEAEVYTARGMSSCTEDSHCAPGFYCEAQACVTKRRHGESCTGANQCASGPCVTGVCCTSCSEQPPLVSSISPTQGKAGTLITFTGTGFVPGSVGKVGSTACTSSTAGSSTTLTCTVPSLTNGTHAVIVTTPDERSSTLASAFLYDGTPPAGGGTLNDGTSSRSLTSSPALTWTAFTDAGSGIDHYEYAIGTTAGGTQTKTWTPFTPGPGPGITLTGLTLTSGTTYYPSIRAYDRVGNFSTITGNGWLVDTTLPSAPTGLNDGTVTSVATAAPVASWTASTDPGGGIAYYELAIGTSVGGSNIFPWTQIGNVTSYSLTGLTLAPGTTYYTSVRAYDHAGNVSATATGDGWKYTLPGASTLVLLPMDNTGPVAGDNSSADFVNFANSGAAFRPVLAPAISTVAPKYGAGSGCFKNGHLSTTASAANVIGTSDFTIEFWVKYSGSLDPFGSTVLSGTGWDISLGNTFYNDAADFALGNQWARHWGGSVGWGVLTKGVWHHLSVSRSGTTLYTHLNGTLRDTITIEADARLEADATTSILTVGNFAPAYIDDLRITVGGVTHTTANFTPTQVGPMPYIYLPLDGTGDGENLSADFRNTVPGGPVMSAVGTPTISTSSTGCGSCGNFNSGSLTTPVSAASAIGTRDFTIEFWVKHSSLALGGSFVIYGGDGASGVYWDISLGNTHSNGAANFASYSLRSTGTRLWNSNIGWGVLPLNTWTHLSLTRSGTTLITHKNGVLVQTATIAATERLEGPTTTSAIRIGGYPSYLDDVMITVGAARHTTANFPVARTPNAPRLNVVEPYVHLPLDGTNGSTAFPNLAATGVTFSPESSPAITTAVSRFGGASGNFQAGSLITAATAANVIGTRDFTLELWVNFNAMGPFGTPVLSGNGWELTLGNTLYNNASGLIFGGGAGSVEWGILPLNTWTHLAVSRSQDRLYTHKNGVLVSTIEIAPNMHMEAGAATSALALGQSPSYLDDVMVTVGGAKYTTANFTVAQLPKPFMYLPMDGAHLSTSFPNYGTGPVVTNVSSPSITTALGVHGGACGNLMAGSLTTAASSAYRLGTQDFTIEFWVNFASRGAFGTQVLAGTAWDITLGNTRYNNGADFAFYPREGVDRWWGGNIGWGILPLNTWVHLSLTRSGTRLYTHKNGVLVSVLAIAATDAMEGPNATSAITIGAYPVYVDDLMVTIGRARHTTANFTVFP